MNFHSDALNGSKEVQTVQRTGHVSGERVMRGLLSFPDTLTQYYISEQSLVIEPTFSWKIFKKYCSIENRQKSEKKPGHQGKRMAREDFC